MSAVECVIRGCCIKIPKQIQVRSTKFSLPLSSSCRMSDNEDMSFEVLGTTPINSYDENAAISVRSAVSRMESDLTRMRLSTSGGSVPATPPPKSPLSIQSASGSHHSNKENRQDVAMDILLRRKSPSADLLKSFVSVISSERFVIDHDDYYY